MRHALIFLLGLGAAYLALRFGNYMNMPFNENGGFFWSYALLAAGIAVMILPLWFLVTNNVIRSFENRRMGVPTASLFFTMVAFAVSAFCYGTLVQPVTSRGPLPWEWLGMGRYEDAALLALAASIVLMFLNFLFDGLQALSRAYKKGDPLKNSVDQAKQSYDALKAAVDRLAGITGKTLEAIQTHDKVAGGKVADIESVLLPQLSVSLDVLHRDLAQLSAVISTRLPAPVPHADDDTSESHPTAHVQPLRTAAGGGGSKG